ncbi:RNA-binding S4 domain-containing protein [Celeribacter ethanolicus]|uniref:RNA-binding protein S4 n=1 Tax=Celeribacter ethanolicus TaxID=1758178 RepID=A0A291GGU7_9RHOB|nr:RNA-binding S4 domain-containing protein [Celeribacter ethanolicus]ATG49589.1 RNA-binding protein S4 [Celeribacter ethanolicus]TNE69022.1 MAG: RNA-binding S4 domain-containing protein [Paracoccaceae bacterium]
MEKRETIRLDKWLWYARFFKTRGLATKTVTGGHVRVNSTKVSKAATSVGAGDVLTFPQGHHIRVIRLVGCGTRRGPAPEAQGLYEDLSPPEAPKDPVPSVPRFEGKGRPTKKDRRMTDLSRPDMLE